MNYLNIRDEIYSQLTGVTGIGKVFKNKKFITDWKTFLDQFYKNNKTIVTWFYLNAAPEEVFDANLAELDESMSLQITKRNEIWTIETYYVFKDDDVNPSEYEFQLLCERIEAKFRFLENLNNQAFFSLPLRRIFSGYWYLGDTLCHKAEWQLELIQRIERT